MLGLTTGKEVPEEVEIRDELLLILKKLNRVDFEDVARDLKSCAKSLDRIAEEILRQTS
ncbi:MAG: hypothetical protein ACYTBJ_00460 [Planctomycetota bacterium]|jgi:hypothetical protein